MDRSRFRSVRSAVGSPTQRLARVLAAGAQQPSLSPASLSRAVNFCISEPIIVKKLPFFGILDHREKMRIALKTFVQEGSRTQKADHHDHHNPMPRVVVYHLLESLDVEIEAALTAENIADPFVTVFDELVCA